MRPGSAVLGPANGGLVAEVLFVGEAPGRLGAGRTGVPFSGDESGKRFDQLLASAGLSRERVFVTNAVLCLPLDARGRNRAPARTEVRACAPWLEATLGLVRAPVVAALGATALAALGCIEPHGLTLGQAAGTCHPWRGRRLVPLYHPSRQAEIHRPWARQVEDWRALNGG
ncbi:MAG TPA: uracil-DNA glycosylase family protein [Tepidiformaceae bacterium]|nr:uracil-DNA glycosylase family protein [Tepidiformaceae bacterium]